MPIQTHQPNLGLSQKVLHDSTHISTEEDLILVVTYRCNSRCTFCIIETEIAQRLQEIDRETINKVIVQNGRQKTFRRLIMSGAEATLRKDLADIATFARSDGNFEHVRIQTNGRKLKDKNYAESLITAGVDEFFVSIHADNPTMDAEITKSTQSFGEMEQGIQNLQDLGARVISNSVVCKENFARLPEMADYLVSLGIRENHFWQFIEMGDVGQAKSQAPLPEIMPKLRVAHQKLTSADHTVTLKWFPLCHLGDAASSLHNHQPYMLIHNAFQERLSRDFIFSCPHRDSCQHHQAGCDGLHHRYIAIFGDERDWLKPVRRTSL